MNQDPNPFPGPLPYRASEKERFFGREQAALQLANNILAYRFLTLYGPSGAGKSSLMQAAVIPALERDHDFRSVTVDSWPAGGNMLTWLADALFYQLDLGPKPTDDDPSRSVSQGVKRAMDRSCRPVLLYLDQIEQLLTSSRDQDGSGALLACLGEIAEQTTSALQIVISLREDYLGRLRHLLRRQRSLVEHTFRLGTLSVNEMATALFLAADFADPERKWKHEEIGSLLLQVRTPGEPETADAEVQAVYAQIVCRSLWEQGLSPGGGSPKKILNDYLDETLGKLGDREEPARILLEDGLIAPDGSRIPLTVPQARGVLKGQTDPGSILIDLERAAILRSEEHQGGRYYELGHDWLAKTVQERKQEAERRADAEAREAQRRRDEESREAERVEEEKRKETNRQDKEKARRTAQVKNFAKVLSIAVVILALAATVAFVQTLKARSAMEATVREKDVAVSILADAWEEKGRQQLLGGDSTEALLWLNLASQLHGDTRRHLLDQYKSNWRSDIETPSLRILMTQAEMDALRLQQSLTGHDGKVLRAEFSFDGKLVVTASQDGTARIWIASTGKLHRTLHVHEGGVLAASFNRAADQVITIGYDDSVSAGPSLPLEENAHRGKLDMTARIWNASNGEQLALLKHDRPLTAVSFSPDGTRVLTAGLDKTAKIWRPSGLLMHTLGHTAAVTDASFSADGARVLTISLNRQSFPGIATLWNSSTGELLKSQEVHPGILAATFTPDGKRVIVASLDNRAMVWDVESGKVIDWLGQQADSSCSGQGPEAPRGDLAARCKWLDLEGITGTTPPTISFSPDGARVVMGGPDKVARIWDTLTGRQIILLKGHSDSVLAANFSRDGTRVVTSSEDRTARIWDASFNVLPFQGHTKNITSISFGGAHDAFLVTGSEDQTAIIWDTRNGKSLYTLRRHQDKVLAVSFNRTGTRIVTASADKTAMIWDAANGKCIRTLQHEKPIQSASFNRDGTRVLTAGADKTAYIWNVKTGGTACPSQEHETPIVTASGPPTASSHAPTRLQGHETPIVTASFSFDGSRVVTASQDGARIWDASNGRELHKLEQFGVSVARFSPDGSSIVTSGSENFARIWDTTTGSLVRSLQNAEGHQGQLTTATFSPDLEGNRVLTASYDKSIKIWETRSGKLLLSLEGHEAPVLIASFSPDLTLVFSASADRTAKIWDAVTGALLLSLKGYQAPPLETSQVPLPTATLSQDGTRVAIAGFHSTAQVWDLPPRAGHWDAGDIDRRVRCRFSYKLEEGHLSFGPVDAAGDCLSSPSRPTR